MRCKDIENRFIFHIENDLSNEEKTEITGHLKDCLMCSEIYKSIQRSLLIIEEQKKLQPSPFLYTRIISKLKANEKFETNIFFRFPIINTVVIFLILIVTAYAGYFIGNKYYPETKQEFANSEMTLWNDLTQEPIENAILSEK